MKPPAFQFYPDDFIGGTVALTTVDVGAYMRLLCYQWGNGKIPSDKSAVDRVAGCLVSDDVMAKFPNGKNKRLESERRKQAEYREKQRQNGIASGRARRSTTVQPPFNHRSTKPEPRVVAVSLEPNTNSPSPSPSPSPKEEGRGVLAEIPSWEEFWEYCQSVHCGIAAEWYAKDKYWAACQDKWSGKSDWRAYAIRVRGWWDNDGRPMKPKTNHANNSKPNPRNFGVVGDLAENARKTAEFVKRKQAEREANEPV